MKRPYETHRCDGSLANHCSIRRYSFDRFRTVKVEGAGWELSKLRYDSEYLTPYMSYVANIKVCPWCGKELK